MTTPKTTSPKEALELVKERLEYYIRWEPHSPRFAGLDKRWSDALTAVQAAIPVAELHEQKAELLPMALILLPPDRLNFLKGELKQRAHLLDTLLTQLKALK